MKDDAASHDVRDGRSFARTQAPGAAREAADGDKEEGETAAGERVGERKKRVWQVEHNIDSIICIACKAHTGLFRTQTRDEEEEEDEDETRRGRKTQGEKGE